MRERIRHAALLAVLLWAFAPGAAEACSCISSGPACQTFWKTDAVFDADVEAVEPIEDGQRIVDGMPASLAPTRVRMIVRQAWKGVSARHVELFESHRGGGCGYEFKPGRRYLVFATARPGDGRLSASICSLTREFNGTGEAADFLASLASPPRGGRVFGTVSRSERAFDPERSARNTPIEARVILSGAETRTAVSTEGRYEFTNVRPGDHRIELVLPDGYTTYNPIRRVRVENEYACAQENYHLSPNGRLSGRVVGKDGRPVARVTIEAAASNAAARPTPVFSPATSRTDADGWFEIGGLPPGSYILGVNLRDLPNEYNPYARTLYPSDGSDAHVLTLGLGQARDVGTWVLPPPLAAVRVSGVALWPDGRPASGVYIHAWDETGNPVDRARGVAGATAGADGTFTITLRAGRVYRFTAGGLLPISAPVVHTNGEVPPIRIVVQPPRQAPFNLPLDADRSTPSTAGTATWPGRQPQSPLRSAAEARTDR